MLPVNQVCIYMFGNIDVLILGTTGFSGPRGVTTWGGSIIFGTYFVTVEYQCPYAKHLRYNYKPCGGIFR